MAMTDEQAKRLILSALHTDGKMPCDDTTAAHVLMHALRAIEDRANLLEGAEELIQEECDEETKGGWMACRMRDARLHMEGKERDDEVAG